jgi:hypothetical protein
MFTYIFKSLLISVIPEMEACSKRLGQFELSKSQNKDVNSVRVCCCHFCFVKGGGITMRIAFDICRSLGYEVGAYN